MSKHGFSSYSILWAYSRCMWAIHSESSKIFRCFHLATVNKAECVRFFIVYSSSFKAKFVRICRVELGTEQEKNSVVQLHDSVILCCWDKHSLYGKLKRGEYYLAHNSRSECIISWIQESKNLKELVSLHLLSRAEKGQMCPPLLPSHFLYSYTVQGPALETLLPALGETSHLN